MSTFHQHQYQWRLEATSRSIGFVPRQCQHCVNAGNAISHTFAAFPSGYAGGKAFVAETGPEMSFNESHGRIASVHSRFQV
jgi:hypothetical protein